VPCTARAPVKREIETEMEIEIASRNGPFWFFGGQSCQSRVVSDRFE
jgi:hypothetical protein